MQKHFLSAISFLLVLSLCGCGADTGTQSAAISFSAETATPVPTPTAEPTPTPVPFSYENVFSEIFSDEALLALYPEIKDYDKERTRISGNIARIEDFEFYELTAEEQEFIKQAQQGNIDESSAEELRKVLLKIYEKDPYVFDDVDNEVKVQNRIKYLLLELKNLDSNPDPELYESAAYYESIKKVLMGNNCGHVQNVSAKMAYISAGTNINSNYFHDIVLPDYESNSWQGNYAVFDFSNFLLDGSDGQKIAKKLYEANVKFFNSDKKDIENGLNEFMDECLHIAFINDELQKSGGIKSLNSKMHYAIIYDYCYYYVLHSISDMEPNSTYSVPDEFAEKAGLQNSNLNFDDIYNLMTRYLGSRESIYNSAVEELQQAQDKYS